MRSARLIFAATCVAIAGQIAPVSGQSPSSGVHRQIAHETTEEKVDATKSVEAAGDLDLDSLLKSDINQLRQTSVAPSLDVEVSTVSRQKSTVGRSPAAVFVIDQKMIRRSGARNIPDLLRLVPGVQVARVDANKYAITIRGFNNRFANKLLVQIDGRSVYTPAFGGVYWDVQDLFLADIERIEVIRGPGATVWGANAVNGVINIITKNARDTVGVNLNAGAGHAEERGFAGGRVGGHASENLHWRFYGKHFDRDRGANSLGIQDDWQQGRGGFRMDWDPDCCNTVTLQGDLYNGTSGTRQNLPLAAPPFVLVSNFEDKVRGGNALMRWTHRFTDDHDFQLQFYYDRTERVTRIFQEDRSAFDADFQHRFMLGDIHRMIWGANFRSNRDTSVTDGFVIDLSPAGRSLDVISFFVQDEIELVEDELFFTAGSKFEDNDFTGFEYQPSGRVVWNPTDRQAVWGAVSRAIRRPTRVNDDITLRSLTPIPGFFPVLTGSRAGLSEDLMAYELGYRSQPSDRFSYDMATFYHRYNNLFGVFPTGPTTLLLTNVGDAESYGVEISGRYQINDCWSLYGNYSLFRLNMLVPPAVAALTNNREEGTSPRNAATAWLSGDLREDVDLDVFLRYVDNLSGFSIPAYLQMDVRLAWWATDDVEFSVVGRNLLDSNHTEFVGEPFSGDVGTNVRRSVYGMVTWQY